MRNGEGQTAGTTMTPVDGIYWGLSGCCGQYLSKQKGIEAPWLVAVRPFFAGVILVLARFKLHGRDNLRVFRKKRDITYLLAFTIFGITFCQLTYFMTIQISNVGTAAVLQYLSPILTLAVVCMRELRLPKGLELTAIDPFLFGTFVIGTHGDIHSFRITGEVLFQGLLTVVNSMIYTTTPGGLILKYGIYQVLGFGISFGGIVMGAVVRPWNYGVTWSVSIVRALAGVVVVGTAIALGLHFQGVNMIGPLKGSIMGSAEPVFAVTISVFWLGTRFTLPGFLGSALTLGTAFVLTFAHRPGGETTKGTDFSADPQKIPKSPIPGIVQTSGIDL